MDSSGQRDITVANVFALYQANPRLTPSTIYDPLVIFRRDS